MNRLLLIFALLCASSQAQILQQIMQPAPSGAAPCTQTATFVQKESTAVTVHSGTSFTDSTTFDSIATSDAHTVLVALVEFDGSGASTPACTLNSVSMTIAGTPAHQSTNNMNAAIYTILNPGTGVPTFACSGTSISEYYYDAYVANKVSSSTPIRAGTYQATTGPTITVMSNTQDLGVAGMESSGTISAAPAAPENYTNSGTNAAGDALASTGASTQTFTWTASGSQAIVGASLMCQTN